MKPSALSNNYNPWPSLHTLGHSLRWATYQCYQFRPGAAMGTSKTKVLISFIYRCRYRHPLKGQKFDPRRWGLQEQADTTSPIEWNTAFWDLFILWTLPYGGILMILDHHWWPAVALAGGSALIDTGGRELAKHLALKTGGVTMGSHSESIVISVTFVIMIVLGLAAVAVSLPQLGQIPGTKGKSKSP
jgi:hypothetical protein